MKFLYNRFAFIPRLCLECKRYIWLEGYRRAEVWKKAIEKPIKENICKSCLINSMLKMIDERRSR